MSSARHAVRIRIAVEADLPGILSCLHSAFEPYRQAYTPVAWTATVLTLPTARRRLRSMTVWVAVDRDGQVLGTIAAKATTSDHAHLRGMAVLPDYQEKGIASALLDSAIAHARKEGQRCVTLETTEPLERASQFYLRRGFRRSGRTRRWGGMRLIGFERIIATRSRRIARSGSKRGSNLNPAPGGRPGSVSRSIAHSGPRLR